MVANEPWVNSAKKICAGCQWPAFKKGRAMLSDIPIGGSSRPMTPEVPLYLLRLEDTGAIFI
jgi:hypothetical protein